MTRPYEQTFTSVDDTTVHLLKCGCKVITYKAVDSATLARHKKTCKGKQA